MDGSWFSGVQQGSEEPSVAVVATGADAQVAKAQVVAPPSAIVYLSTDGESFVVKTSVETIVMPRGQIVHLEQVKVQPYGDRLWSFFIIVQKRGDKDDWRSHIEHNKRDELQAIRDTLERYMIKEACGPNAAGLV